MVRVERLVQGELQGRSTHSPVDRELPEAEQDAEVVFRICQLRAAVGHGGSTISASTNKSVIPTRRNRSVAKGASPSDIVKYTDQTGN
jgi:hypothetical protein